MDPEVFNALLPLGGSVIGTFIGVLVNSRLLVYRMEQLEKKMDKHNQVIDRVYHLESRDAVMTEELKVVNHRLSDLEDHHR